MILAWLWLRAAFDDAIRTGRSVDMHTLTLRMALFVVALVICLLTMSSVAGVASVLVAGCALVGVSAYLLVEAAQVARRFGDRC